MRGSDDQTTKRKRKMKRQRKTKVKRPKNQRGGLSEQVRDYIRLCVKQEGVEGRMETATVFRFQYGLKKMFLSEASMTPAKAFFFAMGIGSEQRLAVQERNESEMVDVRRTMPMLLQLRRGDKVQIKANQRSYGFFLLCCASLLF